MKIYYNKKDGIYIPADWNVEIKNDKLVYSIYGKGYVKTSMKFIEELEIDLKPVNNYTEAWIIYSKYGKDVLKKLIPNNAEYWKDSYCFITSAGEKACKLFDQFKEYFEKDISFFIDIKLRCLGYLVFDITEFEKYILNKFEYYNGTIISLKDFIKLTFGQEQVTCIENLIDLSNYIKQV
jgi:hypothetical protein